MNYANYWKKHHPELHHMNTHKEFLMPTIVLEMLQIEQQQQQQVAQAAWNNDDIFWGAQVVTNKEVEIWDQSKEVEIWDQSPTKDRWVTARPDKDGQICYEGWDTHDPKCHEPQNGVPKMDTWRGCDDLSQARPDPWGTEDRLQSQAPLSCSTPTPSAHN